MKCRTGNEDETEFFLSPSQKKAAESEDSKTERPELSTENNENNGEEKAKYFWLIPVWLKDSFGFLELTQRTIINAIKQLNDSSEWGITSEYDIAINRQGEGMDTTYTVTPCKPAPAPKEAKDAYEEIRLSIDFDQYIDSGRILKQAVKDDDLPF